MAVIFSLLNTTVLADSPTEVKVDKVIEHGVDQEKMLLVLENGASWSENINIHYIIRFKS